MRPEAANLDADTNRAIRHHEEWFAKHGRGPQGIGFFDAGYEDENPGNDPLTRALHKYANYADAVEAFLAFKPVGAPIPRQLTGKTAAEIGAEWESRAVQVRAWEELEKAQARYFSELRNPENKVEPVGNGTLYTTFRYPDRVDRYRREMEKAQRRFEKVDAGRILPRVRTEREAHEAHQAISKGKHKQEKDAREELWKHRLDEQRAQETIARWEGAVVSHEPLRAMLNALGPGRVDYAAAERAFAAWEASWFGPSGRALIVAGHPDPRRRASWEIRRWLLPLRYAYEDPKHFFIEIAPQLDPDGFDPSKIAPSPFHATYLARTLRNWGFGVLLNPTVRAAFDDAAKYPYAFGDALAIAERRTTFPKDGSRKGGKKNRKKSVEALAERMSHWLSMFGSRNSSGKWRLLKENGVSHNELKRLPTVEGCALRACAQERDASLDAIRKQWNREKMDTRGR